MAVSHANCTHPRTPAGRRTCRKSQAIPAPVPIWAPRSTPRLPHKPVRIQPRRSGARVSANASTCVQAALHNDAHGGRCACGWEAKVA